MGSSGINLEPGTLWRAIVDRTRQALASGALRPIETEREILQDQGIAFDVRVVSSLALKAHEANPEVHPPDFDPFLPYDPELFVADISETHVGILNKFPVVDNHLLIVTREFQEQSSLLTQADFEALWACMQEFDGLAFYNSGETAGASQHHKHLQLIPDFSDGPALPIEEAVADIAVKDDIGRCSALPFKHAIATLGEIDALPINDAASALLGRYRSMLHSLNLMEQPDKLRNYNLLATRRWMMLVPRSREQFEGVSVNALGFAGELLVMDRPQLETLRKLGPMAALRAVTT